MSQNLRKAGVTATASCGRSSPVRVKLKRIDCNQAKPYPPDGMSPEWWNRLKNALGTCSRDFVQASIHQIIGAARLPGSGICEVAVNAALAFIEGARPRGEVEAALVMQMACTHIAAMAVLARFNGACGGERSVTATTNAASRLLRAYATQVEALRRLRNGGSQFVRVEHVHVYDGGQAAVGAFSHGQTRQYGTSCQGPCRTR